MSNQTVLMMSGAGAAVLVLGIAVFAMSGEKKRPPRPRKPRVRKVLPASRIDFHTEGMRRGYDWRHRMRNRRKAFTPEEVHMVADRMTSDYANKGITPDGAERFKRAFCKAVLGK